MWPELGEQWQLTPRQYSQFDQREGTYCTGCGSSLRSRQMARVLVKRWNQDLGTAHKSLRTLGQDPKASRLSVAEINAAGNLHPFLEPLPGLRYSEYGSTAEQVPSESLDALSYEDGSFDYVLTSDTLEHIPDLTLALAEIRRVLKPGGCHIFTIPVVWERVSRTRATMINGAVVHSLPPSRHGSRDNRSDDLLVFHEFGSDVVAEIERAGFDLEVVKDERNPSLSVFVARRT